MKLPRVWMAAAAVLVLVILGATALSQASAGERFELPPAPTQPQEPTQPPEVLPPAPSEPLAEGLTTEPGQPLEALSIPEMLEKLQAANRITYPQQGWVLMRTQHLRDIDDPGGPLPNGKYQAKDYVEDTWMHFNEQGLVDTQVFTQKSLAGELIQSSVYQNGIATGHTDGVSHRREPEQWEALDRGYTKGLRQINEQWPEAVTLELLEDGQVARFTITTNLGEPTKVAHYTEKLGVASVAIIDFDIATGRVLYHDNIIFFEDDTQRISDHITVEIQTNATLSEEALAFLENQ